MIKSLLPGIKAQSSEEKLHMERLGDTGYYGEGMVSLTARAAYNFISSCFAVRLTMMRDSGTGERGQAWETF